MKVRRMKVVDFIFITIGVISIIWMWLWWLSLLKFGQMFAAGSLFILLLFATFIVVKTMFFDLRQIEK